MGVSGSGKSTIGAALADALGATFIEGDDVHTDDNKAKMAAGVALDDTDRGPWLEDIAAGMAAEIAAGRGVVVACSALKHSYRDILSASAPGVVFVHLAGPLELIAARQRGREHEYMPLSLLESQFATLEQPGADERHIDVDVSHTPDEIVRYIIASLPAPVAPAAAGDEAEMTPR
jgi:gluconokinase